MAEEGLLRFVTCAMSRDPFGLAVYGDRDEDWREGEKKREEGDEQTGFETPPLCPE